VQRRSVWRGAAQAVTVAANLSMGVIATAAVAGADTGPASGTDSSSASQPADKPDAVTPTKTHGKPARRSPAETATTNTDTDGPGRIALAKAKRAVAGKARLVRDPAVDAADSNDASLGTDAPDDVEDPAGETPEVAAPHDEPGTAETEPQAPDADPAEPEPAVEQAPDAVPAGTVAEVSTQPPRTTHDGVPEGRPNLPASPVTVAAEDPAGAVLAGAGRAAAATVTLTWTPTERAAARPALAGGAPGAASTVRPAPSTATAVLTAGIETVTSHVTAAVTSAVRAFASVVFAVITGLERLLVGPPTRPTGSTVTVRSSSLQITDGLSVPADWYFPAGDDPPQRLILLQHGFFAVAPMYSHLAARLAEDTNSIVVAPTITSNPLAAGGLWINGAGMHRAIAALFTGDRAALNASALAADYAELYQLDSAEAVLPSQFVLAGHSAGGAAVSVAAGYVIESDAADDLMGVLLLDAVTTEGRLAATLTKLDEYQQQTLRYVPIREIGAPSSSWNSISNVNAVLSAARPDRFNGVVLARGVHTDSMGGGSAISQFLVHLLAGNPVKQNPPAVQHLAVAWVNEWFAGVTDAGDELVPGSRIDIPTPAGTAVGVVIGTPAAVGSAQPAHAA
jgi:hypothetical protein